MIGYITLGSNDLKKSAAFYDAIFTDMDIQKLYDSDNFIAWGTRQAEPMFCVVTAFDGKPATVGNGVMIALPVESQAKAAALHSKALSLGAVNEGDPGMRPGGYYCAYFRDPDGNKLNIYHYSQSNQ